MKPSDHPEFFQFPAPAGRSRESTIVLDAVGRFWHDGAKVEHSRMARAFFSWIQKHPDDGRYILSNGYDWTYLTVEDVPLFIDAVSRPNQNSLLLHLSDGTQELLDPESLSSGPGNATYARVKDGQLEARFRQEAQTGLMPLLEPGADGDPWLQLAGRQYAFKARGSQA